MNIEMRLLSSQEKVFPHQAPSALTVPMDCLQGEIYSFQLAMFPVRLSRTQHTAFNVRLSIESEIPVTAYEVGYEPVRLPYFFNEDGHYLKDEGGLFPDPLLKGPSYKLYTGRWNSILFVAEPGKIAPGTYPIKITFDSFDPELPEYWQVNFHGGNKEATTFTYETELTVGRAELPTDNDFRYTCWFHADCLADYYNVPVFSEEHWKIMAEQIKMAVKYGQNMFLTPIFTPPLDTAVGTERPTVQLIKVTKNGQQYDFDFSLLDRYINMVHECGGTYFEISHLFSQWSSHKCPKIVATEDGKEKRIFGWDTAADSAEYTDFLTQLLPQLTKHLDDLSLRGRVFFHLTDEPHGEYIHGYLQLKNIVEPLLNGYPIMDAMSSYEFFTEGVSECPVVATTALEPFLEGTRPEDFWVYYCCAQGTRDLSNRFLDMPGYRTRVLGVQCFVENVKGFLQWGLNFYNTQLSLKKIDPFKTADGEGSWPAGDPFIIYPGEDGKPLPSQRLIIFGEAIQDVHALYHLASLTSREHVLQLINEDALEPVGFFVYPHGEEYLLKLRQKVNREIAALTK